MVHVIKFFAEMIQKGWEASLPRPCELFMLLCACTLRTVTPYLFTCLCLSVHQFLYAFRFRSTTRSRLCRTFSYDSHKTLTSLSVRTGSWSRSSGSYLISTPFLFSTNPQLRMYWDVRKFELSKFIFDKNKIWNPYLYIYSISNSLQTNQHYHQLAVFFLSKQINMNLDKIFDKIVCHHIIYMCVFL
jgi:hypothetical protein